MRIYTLKPQSSTQIEGPCMKLQRTVGVEQVKTISPFCIFSLDPLPGFVNLDVLVAMARDVEDVFQGVTDPDGLEKR